MISTKILPGSTVVSIRLSLSRGAAPTENMPATTGRGTARVPMPNIRGRGGNGHDSSSRGGCCEGATINSTRAVMTRDEGPMKSGTPTTCASQLLFVISIPLFVSIVRIASKVLFPPPFTTG